MENNDIYNSWFFWGVMYDYVITLNNQTSDLLLNWIELNIFNCLYVKWIGYKLELLNNPLLFYLHNIPIS